MFDTYLGTIIVTMDKIRKYVCSWIPSYVESVTLIPSMDDCVIPFYQSTTSMFSWNRAAAVTRVMLQHMDDYFLIKVWDTEECKHISYLVRGSMLCEALGTKHVSYVWAYHDCGIVSLLNKWAKRFAQPWNLLALRYNGIDISNDLRNIKGSLSIPNNITAKALIRYYEACILQNQITHQKKDEDQEYVVTVMNCELDEKECKGDEYII